MKLLAALALLTVSTTCLAAKPVNTTLNGSGCPVEIDDFGTGPQPVQVNVFQLKFKNTSEKTIIGSDFSLDWMNAVGDFVPYIAPIDVADKIQPGKKARFLGKIIPAAQYRTTSGFRVSLRKLAFSDGTTWEDDGTMKCQTVQDMRRQ